MLEERKSKHHLEEQLQHSSFHAADMSVESQHAATTFSELHQDIAMLHKASQEHQGQQQVEVARLEAQHKGQVAQKMQQLGGKHAQEIRCLEEEHALEVQQLEEVYLRQDRAQAQMREVQLEAARAYKAQADRGNRELRLERDELMAQNKHIEAEYKQMQRWYTELQEEVDAVLQSSDATEAEVKALKAQLHEQKEAVEQAQQREARLKYEFDKKRVPHNIGENTRHW